MRLRTWGLDFGANFRQKDWCYAVVVTVDILSLTSLALTEAPDGNPALQPPSPPPPNPPVNQIRQIAINKARLIRSLGNGREAQELDAIIKKRRLLDSWGWATAKLVAPAILLFTTTLADIITHHRLTLARPRTLHHHCIAARHDTTDATPRDVKEQLSALAV